MIRGFGLEGFRCPPRDQRQRMVLGKGALALIGFRKTRHDLQDQGLGIEGRKHQEEERESARFRRRETRDVGL